MKQSKRWKDIQKALHTKKENWKHNTLRFDYYHIYYYPLEQKLFHGSFWFSFSGTNHCVLLTLTNGLSQNTKFYPNCLNCKAQWVIKINCINYWGNNMIYILYFGSFSNIPIWAKPFINIQKNLSSISDRPRQTSIAWVIDHYRLLFLK